MYKNSSARSRGSSFGGRNASYRGRKSYKSNNRSRRGGQNIDPRRFVKAAKPVEKTVYEPTHKFGDFAIDDLLKNNLSNKGYETPTKIQDKAIPDALQGHDVIGIANTGTGKTAAFLLPLLQKLITNRGEKALILAPTRELALQIEQECREFAVGTRLLAVMSIGGVPLGPQLRGLRQRPEIVIGTPGRIKDHIDRGSLQLDSFTTVVLDEVDRMLDMGFINDIRTILAELPTKRQSLFFSATMSPTIEGLIKTFTSEPVTIMARTAETSDNVDQSVIKYAARTEKMDKLHELLLEDHVEKTLIFSETKRAVERLSKELSSRGFMADAMHGDKSQGQRQRALKSFRDDHINILVATDVAARGIDVDGITHVVNYDIPQNYDDYTHRIGRTGRGNNIGYAVTFVTH